MINAIGLGWTFTIFGFLYLLGAPVLLIIMKYGIRMRRNLREKEERKKAKETEKMQNVS
jgi:hypothetical protein